jgi:hypothetical protein
MYPFRVEPGMLSFGWISLLCLTKVGQQAWPQKSAFCSW